MGSIRSHGAPGIIMLFLSEYLSIGGACTVVLNESDPSVASKSFLWITLNWMHNK